LKPAFLTDSRLSLAFPRILPYMRRSIAHWRHVYWPLLDDIPAVGVPFPQIRKEKHDVDYC
jgi:hypothetical protein